MHQARIAVLVAEDDPLLRLNIVDELEDAGFQIYETANAAEALEVLHATAKIDVLFTDVDMPGQFDGLMLAALVNEQWPSTKIIVTSGHLKLAQGKLSAAGEFVPKPYRPDAIVASIHRLMA
jgi:CheY-like chemotaxis protein